MNRWIEAELLLLRGRFHFRAKRYEPALGCYLRVVEVLPNHMLAHFRAGYCLIQLDRYPEALAEYEKALQIDPGESTIHAWMSIALKHLGNLQAAAESMERVYRNCPPLKKPHKAAWWRDHLAHIYSQLGDWQRAAENFRLSWEAKPSENALSNWAIAQWRAGDKDTSLETHRKAAGLFPNSAEAQYHLGWALFNIGRPSEAVAPLKRAISFNPNHADAWYHLGLTLEKPGESLTALRKAAELRPEHPDTHYSIGVALGDLRDFGGSIAAYREAVRLKPGYPSAWFNMGLMYSALDKPDDEIEAYKSALRYDDRKADAWGNLAITCSDKKMYQEALQAYRKVCELQPENELAYYLAGCSLFFLGRHAEAVVDFQRAIQIDPDYISAHEWLGYTFAILGRFLEAFACYEAAMRLAPNSAQLHKELADFHEWRGQEAEAAQFRAKAAEFESQGIVDPLTTLPQRPIDKPIARAPPTNN